MIHHELHLSPFDRRSVGAKNHIILRRNHEHIDRSRKAIERREHPEWSCQRVTFEVAA